MPAITTDAKREIVKDFAKLIRQKKTTGAKPAHTVINFRNEKKDGIERPKDRFRSAYCGTERTTVASRLMCSITRRASARWMKRNVPINSQSA